jgi:hypothetical protein
MEEERSSPERRAGRRRQVSTRKGGSTHGRRVARLEPAWAAMRRTCRRGGYGCEAPVGLGGGVGKGGGSCAVHRLVGQEGWGRGECTSCQADTGRDAPLCLSHPGIEEKR